MNDVVWNCCILMFFGGGPYRNLLCVLCTTDSAIAFSTQELLSKFKSKSGRPVPSGRLRMCVLCHAPLLSNGSITAVDWQVMDSTLWRTHLARGVVLWSLMTFVILGSRWLEVDAKKTAVGSPQGNISAGPFALSFLHLSVWSVIIPPTDPKGSVPPVKHAAEAVESCWCCRDFCVRWVEVGVPESLEFWLVARWG